MTSKMISTHILDTSLGVTAKDVAVELAKYENNKWQILGAEKTDSDGRIVFKCAPARGVYRLKFAVEDYFLRNKITPFFIVAPVVFKIEDLDRKYHIPLLLNPFGYSTYRGS